MAEFSIDQLRDVEDVVSPSHDAERTLIAAIRELSVELSVDGASAAALDAAERMFGATSSWIMLREPSSQSLRLTASRGPDSDVCPCAATTDQGPALPARVCSERKAVFVPDVRAERRWLDQDRLRVPGRGSLLMVPLLFKQQPVGVMALTSPQFTASSPPETLDVERLLALAAQAAIACTNARILEESEGERRRLRQLFAQQSRRIRQRAFQQKEMAGESGIIGTSRQLNLVVRHAALVAPSETTVLLLGETGTGKELLARLIHRQSRRRKGPFNAVNCAAMPHSLIESELFGHERGAFTGATERKPGSFEVASGGTIFLDEVGDLPGSAQAKLLRVLQERSVRRLGGSRSLPVDVRVVAATNHDLDRAIERQQFRTDLFYRLNVFPIHIPALRERPDDIEVLASHLVQRFANRLGRSIEGLTADAISRLRAYQWPGNVRELQNTIERAVILSTAPVIDAGDLCLPDAAGPLRTNTERRGDEARPASLADAERRTILEALEATGWRVSGAGGAGERLGIRPTTLHSRMQRLGLKRSGAHAPGDGTRP
jgi:transcriptional regulator with GAF, ATPase, and Fis domain